MEDDTWYSCQSILVHELAHAVLNLSLASEVQQELLDCYDQARQNETYPPDSYLLSNEQEYFAVLSESWFESTLRDDLNGGVRSRDDIKARDPGAARIMLRAWGDGSWRFTDDCPIPLTKRKKIKEPTHLPPPPQLGHPPPLEPPQNSGLHTSPAPIGSTMERQPSDDDHIAQCSNKRKFIISDELGEEGDDNGEGFSHPRPFSQSGVGQSTELCSLSNCFPTPLLSLQLGLVPEMPKEEKTR